jgi:hypothetical protein
MPSPILARADALMQRRRQNAEVDDVPVLTDAIDINTPETDDDVPVLFDIDPIAPLSSTVDAFLPVEEAALPELPEILIEEPPLPELIEVATPCPAPDASLPAVVVTEEIAREIARRVEQRLTAELPRIIEATVRDFLAEQTTTGGQQADFQG